MRRLRLFLACLLLVAVPFQGMAAAAMLFCGLPPHEAASVAAQPTHHHGHAAAQVQDDRAAVLDHHDGPGFADAKCSACAACCWGAAVADDMQLAAFPAPSHVVALTPSAAVRMRAMPPPDKPPRA